MGDSAMVVVAIFLAAILMFVFPLMTMADKKDDMTALTVQTATTEFTNAARETGTITQDEYNNLLQTLASTGNSYDVEITVQVSDENPAKKEMNIRTTIGENVYYTLYTTQILDEINSEAKKFVMKSGDIITVDVKNTNLTLGMQLRNFIYKVTGNNSATISFSASGLVSADGN